MPRERRPQEDRVGEVAERRGEVAGALRHDAQALVGRVAHDGGDLLGARRDGDGSGAQVGGEVPDAAGVVVGRWRGGRARAERRSWRSWRRVSFRDGGAAGLILADDPRRLQVAYLLQSPPMTHPATARLLISCPDGPGIVAAVSAFLFGQGANIVTSDQHSTDPSGGRFFMRMEFTLDLDDDGWAALEREFAQAVAEPRAMEWRLARVSGPRRLAVLASREDHCLLDVLWRASRGELDAEVAVVISNHETARRAVEGFGVRSVTCR